MCGENLLLLQLEPAQLKPIAPLLHDQNELETVAAENIKNK